MPLMMVSFTPTFQLWKKPLAERVRSCFRFLVLLSAMLTLHATKQSETTLLRGFSGKVMLKIRFWLRKVKVPSDLKLPNARNNSHVRTFLKKKEISRKRLTIFKAKKKDSLKI